MRTYKDLTMDHKLDMLRNEFLCVFEIPGQHRLLF